MSSSMSRRGVLAMALASVLAACGRAASRKTVASQPVSAQSTPVSPQSAVASSQGVSATTAVPRVSASTMGPSSPAVEIAHGPRTRPEVALTFHGAGDPALASAILQTAKSRRMHLTVMAVGSWLQANPTFARAILDGGHELGNHTWSHPILTQLGEPAVTDEIVRCRDLIRRLTGSPGTYFRQSSAQFSTPLIRRVAGAAGYRVCLSYELDSMDWTDPGPDAIRQNVATAVAGSIVSLHLGHQGTVVALPGIIDDLDARGLKAVTVSRLLRA